MKSLYAFMGLFLMQSTVFAQWLTQSGDGKGTVLLKGSTIALDATTSELSFSINNLYQPVRIKSEKDNHIFFFGGNLNAKSEEGIASLFSTGDFVPAAKINGYFGYVFSRSSNAKTIAQKAKDDKAAKDIGDRQVVEFESRMRPFMDSVIQIAPIDDPKLRELVKTNFSNGLKDATLKSFFDFLKGDKTSDKPEVKIIINTLLEKINAINKENLEEKATKNEEREAQFEAYKKRKISSWYIFPFGGIDALTFKRVDKVSPIDLSGSFIKEEYRGGNAGVGINFQRGRWKAGITYSYHETNNFSSLTKTDYKLTTTTSNTATNQTLVQEKSLTGYSGTYGKVKVNELNIDATFNLNLNKTQENFALINPYFRSVVFSRDTKLLPNNYTFGLGLYFFNNSAKFLGGLYVELPDVEDAIEKAKPVDEQNTRTAIKRFTFGIVTKFSIGSVIGSQ